MPAFIEPLLLTLYDQPPEGEGWIHEIKYDGYRVQIHINNGKAVVFTRRGKDWSEPFAWAVKAAEKLKLKTAIIDAEACAVDENGKTNFSALRNGKDNPRACYCFDLLYLNGQDLRGEAIEVRRAALKKLLGSNPVLRFSEAIDGDVTKIFKHACALGLEGIVSKQRGSKYVSGRQTIWRKAKCPRSDVFVIGAYRLSTHVIGGVAALYIGERNGKQLLYRGKVGTGWSDKMSGEMKTKLQSLQVDVSPFTDRQPGKSEKAIFVKPVAKVEIKYTEVTEDGSLRHPSLKRLL